VSGHPRSPSQIIGEMLTGHPEAASLLAEASHCQALARASAAIVRRTFAAAQVTRLGCEGLLHRLDPRRRRTVNFGSGLLIIGLMGAGLTLLDAIELGGMWAVLPALAITAVWLTGAWLAALACRDRRWPWSSPPSSRLCCSVSCPWPWADSGRIRAGRRLMSALARA
jgi:hypothetical protein